MYHLSINKDERRIEGSLGGRVTAGEVYVFGDDLLGMLEEHPGYRVVLNWSKAAPFDSETYLVLDEYKDKCLDNGTQITSIVRSDEEVAWYQEYRREQILQGKLTYVLDASLEELAAADRGAAA